MSDASEAAKTRRRWLTLGEIVAVLALLISAASFWDSHQERVSTRTAVRPSAAVPLVLKAGPDHDGTMLTITAAGVDRVIQTQTISFPTALDLKPIDTIGNARIEAGWFADALRKASPAPRHNGRLPVAIVTRFTDNGTEHEDSAIYDIGHGWRTRLLQSDVPRLEGITLVSRGGKDLAKRLDARWNKLHPAG